MRVLDIIDKVGLVAALTVPLWNVPLIVRIYRRKSSQDISLCWVLGVWVSFVLMFPSGLRSQDIVWKLFNIVNLIFFSFVALFVVIYRIKEKH